MNECVLHLAQTFSNDNCFYYFSLIKLWPLGIPSMKIALAYLPAKIEAYDLEHDDQVHL